MKSGHAGALQPRRFVRLNISGRHAVSRRGTNTGRGFGFHPLFTGLANLNGNLHSRSGDYQTIKLATCDQQQTGDSLHYCKAAPQ